MNLRSETGVVLIIVLILLTAISLASIHVLSQGMLLAKTMGSFQRQMFNWLDAENSLLKTEWAIQKNPQNYLELKVAFVADHLELGCTEGVDIFKVTVPPFQSLIAVRHP